MTELEECEYEIKLLRKLLQIESNQDNVRMMEDELRWFVNRKRKLQHGDVDDYTVSGH